MHSGRARRAHALVRVGCASSVGVRSQIGLTGFRVSREECANERATQQFYTFSFFSNRSFCLCLEDRPHFNWPAGVVRCHRNTVPPCRRRCRLAAASSKRLQLDVSCTAADGRFSFHSVRIVQHDSLECRRSAASKDPCRHGSRSEGASVGRDRLPGLW